MTNNKIKESIQIAEELAKEICTGKTSTSLLAKEWKKEQPELYEELKKQNDLHKEIAFHNSIDMEASIQRMHQRIFPGEKRKQLTIRILGIAASLMLIVGTTHLWLSYEQKEKTSATTDWTTSMPGTAKTLITTPDNQTIELEESNLAVKDNQLLIKRNDGTKKVAINLEKSPQFNKLSVPPGGEYQLTLPDGTTVKVNTASELLFPAQFDRHTRQVRLKGEAYFQVETDKKKTFIVQLDNALSVHVKGTSFNIKAYEEENEVSIALVEGKVDVQREDQVLATLTPGQLFTYRKNEAEFHVESTDLSTVTDWTNGTFIFRNEPIENIMRKLSRWYNVDITVNEAIKDIRYTGILSRKQPLMETLDALRMTNELDFNLHKDKKIDVQEKKNQH